MKKFAIIAGILAILIVCFFIVVLIIGLVAGSHSYNQLVSLSQNADSKWAQVENDYQRRADLIPNLVSTVSGAANF
jgi:LemA protein